jgi:transcriptional regulator with XRE-family HTH domain
MNNQEDKEKEGGKETCFSSSFQSDEKSALGNRIKEAVAGDHVKAFARRCGIPESSLRSYIMNQKRPGADALYTISTATGVTIDWLVTGRGIKYVKDLRDAQERLKGAPPRATGSLPDALEPYRRRIDALHGYLAQIDDDRVRDRIISDFLLRAEELKEIGELKQAVTELRAAFDQKTG